MRKTILTAVTLISFSMILSACGPAGSTKEFAKDTQAFSGNWRIKEIEKTQDSIKQCDISKKCDPEIQECKKRQLKKFNENSHDISGAFDKANFEFISCTYEFTETCQPIKINTFHKTKGSETEKYKAAQRAYDACVRKKIGY